MAAGWKDEGEHGPGDPGQIGVADVRVDHGLPEMTYMEAFERRAEVTPIASQKGLIEAANREVFHRRGFALTWNPATGDLWLTPTADTEGWSYVEDTP